MSKKELNELSIVLSITLQRLNNDYHRNRSLFSDKDIEDQESYEKYLENKELKELLEELLSKIQQIMPKLN